MKVNVVTDRPYFSYFQASFQDTSEINALKGLTYKFGYETRVTINDFDYGRFISVLVDVNNIHELVKLLKAVESKNELLYYKILADGDI